MSTKIAVISEGPIDMALLPPLISHIAKEKVGIKWPVNSDDAAELLPIRKTGHGGVLEKVRMLVEVLCSSPPIYAGYVIMLDRKTKAVQEEIRRLINGKASFVMGIAIEEVEAWWLGDRTNTLAWAGIEAKPDCRYGRCNAKGNLNYAAEKDDNPKRTLDELTELSDRFDYTYGDGNTDLALDFADNYWKSNAHLSEIRTQCPQGFGRFESDIAQLLRSATKKK